MSGSIIANKEPKDLIWPEDYERRIVCGDALTVLRTMPDEVVQTCITSPPYWGLRDYRVEGQLGLEKTPEEYVAKMVQVFREVRRVLKSDGTLWLNLGDSYANDGKWGGETGGKQAYLSDNDRRRVGREERLSSLKPKDLCMIPARVALALQADGWWLRCPIIWVKPNPMPESVKDRPTRAHEYLFLMAKSERYYYNADAIKEPASHETTKMPDGWESGPGTHGSFHRDGREKGQKTDKQRGHSRRHAGFNDRWDAMEKAEHCSGKRNKRDVWEIATQPYKDAHFATFPEKLVEPCILAGSRERDLVLDPFSGSGTTSAVAKRLARRWVAIELNLKYCRLNQRRVRQEELF